jgi:hypothetical protein
MVYGVWRVAFSILQLPPLLGKLINSCTGCELEAATIKAMRLQENWSSSTPVIKSVAEITCAQPEFTELLPGGRWLLTTEVDGAFRAYDLEASPIQSHALLPPHGPTDGRKLDSISTCILSDEVTFTFEIALRFADLRRRIRLAVWRVELKTLGSCSMLMVNHLHSFDTIEDLCRGSLSLFGDLVSLDQGRRGGQYIDVYRWRLCTSDLHHVASMSISATVSSISISRMRVTGTDPA